MVFLGTSWVLITYIISPPVIVLVLEFGSRSGEILILFATTKKKKKKRDHNS